MTSVPQQTYTNVFWLHTATFLKKRVIQQTYTNPKRLTEETGFQSGASHDYYNDIVLQRSFDTTIQYAGRSTSEGRSFLFNHDEDMMCGLLSVCQLPRSLEVMSFKSRPNASTTFKLNLHVSLARSKKLCSCHYSQSTVRPLLLQCVAVCCSVCCSVFYIRAIIHNPPLIIMSQ